MQTLGIIAHTWLVVADQSGKGIFDDDCLLLSDLHSDAVDYPKSGRPVPLDKIPRTRGARPDWSAPEATKLDPKKFYESRRAIGKLFRAIDLPALHTMDEAQRNQRRQMAADELMLLEDVLIDFHTDECYDEVSSTIMDHVSSYIPLDDHDEQLISEIWEMAESFRLQLQTICADHTVSRTRDAVLTEGEAVVGTIVAKTSQRRKRKDAMSKLREHMSSLVQDVEHQLAGEPGTSPKDSLRRGWVAYRISLLTAHQFGARGIGLIALREIFDCISAIDGDTDGII